MITIVIEILSLMKKIVLQQIDYQMTEYDIRAKEFNNMFSEHMTKYVQHLRN